MQNEHAVLYSFALYVLYVLLPIVPAVVIFKLFPDTKVAVSGPLQKLTVKTSGAFGAYVATVALGFFLVQGVEKRIDDLRATATSYKLNLKPIYVPRETEPNPFYVTVDLYLVVPGGPKIVNDSLYRVQRGQGGVIVNFDNLNLGDMIYLVTRYRDQEWRSDAIMTGDSQVQMSPAQPYGK